MSECICNSCKNLKNVFVESDNNPDEMIEVLECEFDFPSEDCVTCELDGCELTCEHYVKEEEEEVEEEVVAHCAKCGKELKISKSNSETGTVYCVMCYLNGQD